MKVMFKDSNGSIGDTGDRGIESSGNGRVYVTWNYGKDVNGSPITSSTGYSVDEAKKKLIQIPEDLYQEYVDCRAWSDEQKMIREKITGNQRYDESKSCRTCKYWAADPDDEYCGHPKALSISPFGINLNRARGNFAYKTDKPDQDPAFNICGPRGVLWEIRK